jgi:predicted AlkP superfamily pyrophosphatase or phosphodiesterase
MAELGDRTIEYLEKILAAKEDNAMPVLKRLSMPFRLSKSAPRGGFGKPGAFLIGLALGLVMFLLYLLSTQGRVELRPLPAPQRPTLVLWVTVDALRSDMVSLLQERFPDGGFRYLTENGAWYLRAFFQSYPTLTAVGHACLFTGGFPSSHGLVGNDWSDPNTGSRIYCLEDSDHSILGQDPQPHSGTSPRNLLGSTFGDELVLASGSKSRVFAVSGKDRGAIIPAGRLGKAFWYSSSLGTFVTSSYYLQDYPDWMKQWRERRLIDAYAKAEWQLLQEVERYNFRSADDRPEERGYGMLGRTFPHAINAQSARELNAVLPYTPFLDELTLDFALELLAEAKIGSGPEVDMLSLSLSSTDYIGHAFGPDSLEYEDNILRVDSLLARLFAAVDAQVGLERALIVLAADHGMDAIPEFRLRMGFPAGRHQPQEWISRVNRALKAKYEIEKDLVVAFWNPSLYFDRQALQRLGLALEEVEKTVAEEMMRVPGIALAISRSDMLAGNVPETELGRRLERAFHPQRSGNVLIIQDPFWYLYPDPEAYAAMHGSPYIYDIHVPVMITGPRIRRLTVSRPVSPEDIAPSLAAYFGLTAPPLSSGNVLPGLFD